MILRPVEGDVHEDVEGHNKLLQAMVISFSQRFLILKFMKSLLPGDLMY